MRSATPAIDEVTALDRYVAAPDPSYRYELIETIPGDGYAAYVLEMTSQRWRDGDGGGPPVVEALVDRHRVIEPEQQLETGRAKSAAPELGSRGGKARAAKLTAEKRAQSPVRRTG